MRQTTALVLEREALQDGWQRVTLHVPELGGALRPGQLLAIQAGGSAFDPLLKVAVHVTAADAAAGTAGVLCRSDGSPPLLHRAGDRPSVLGPIGRGWSVHEQTRNVVLVGSVPDVGALLFLAAVATTRSMNVALLVGAAEGQPGLAPALVPPSVEYQLARGASAESAALDLLDDALLKWCDAIYTTLPLASYPELARRIRAARLRWEQGFAQGLLVPPMACFTGICDVCLVPEARRAWRACADGPQCDLRDFVR